MLHLLAVVALLFSSAEARTPDEKDGWKDAKWGSEPAADMRCSPQKDHVEHLICSRESGEDRVVGEDTMDLVRYHYWQRRLYSVDIGTMRREVGERLRLGLAANYGAGTVTGVNSCAWMGDLVAVNYSGPVISSDKASGVTFTYLPTYRELEAAKAAKTAGDL